MATHPDGYFLLTMQLCAAAALAGFILADLARRSTLPWYDLIVLAVASFAASSLTIDWLAVAVGDTSRTVARLAVGMAVSVGGAGAVPLVVMIVSIVMPLACGLLLALALTLASRLLLGLPLRAADTRREFWANLAGAYVWLTIGIGGYLAIRSLYQLPLGHPDSAIPRWLPLAGACLAAIAALAVQLWLAHRVRRDELSSRHGLKVWALAAGCVFAWFHSPGLFGHTGFRLMNDQLRPALRALHVLPTPAIAIADYRVDVPFHDTKVTKGTPMPDGKPSFVAVPLPDEYGLTSTNRNPRVFILRRDITLREMSYTFWIDHRIKLEEAQTARPGRDVIVVLSFGRVGRLALRSDEYPQVDIQLVGFDPAMSTEAVEQVMRRFLRERLQRVG